MPAFTHRYIKRSRLGLIFVHFGRGYHVPLIRESHTEAVAQNLGKAEPKEMYVTKLKEKEGYEGCITTRKGSLDGRWENLLGTRDKTPYEVQDSSHILLHTQATLEISPTPHCRFRTLVRSAPYRHRSESIPTIRTVS